MSKKTVSISLPKIEGIELKNATVDLEKGVVVAEYGEEDGQVGTSEIAVDFGSAVDYLLEDLHLPAFRTTKKHMTKLSALNQLMILAEAWNSFDKFKPDWDNLKQGKYYPFFEIKNGKLEFSQVGAMRWILATHMSDLVFKSPKRAKQFATKFIDLFRIVLTN